MLKYENLTNPSALFEHVYSLIGPYTQNTAKPDPTDISVNTVLIELEDTDSQYEVVKDWADKHDVLTILGDKVELLITDVLSEVLTINISSIDPGNSHLASVSTIGWKLYSQNGELLQSDEDVPVIDGEANFSLQTSITGDLQVMVYLNDYRETGFYKFSVQEV